jgi:predicted metallopeptidase
VGPPVVGKLLSKELQQVDTVRMDGSCSRKVKRSYWIPGSYAAMLSENHDSFLRLLKNNDFEGRENDKSRVVRHRPIHAPGIQ